MSKLKAGIAGLAAIAVLAVISPAPSSGHRSGCHRWHTCPSDHATYRWHGWLCVSPASGESRYGYPHRVRYGGRTYYCRRR